MASVSERCGAIWQRVRSSPARLPAQVAIPRSHIAGSSSMGSAFAKNQDYFQVRFNQVFLSDRRRLHPLQHRAVQDQVRRFHAAFYEQFERAKKTAGHADASSWLRARADDASLWQTVLNSPDLTESHAEELSAEYRAKIQKIHSYAVDNDVLGPASGLARMSRVRQATALLET